jgi:hypothetical protein
MNAIEAATVCAVEEPWAGTGNAATARTPRPPIASRIRPAGRADGMPAAVTRWQQPSTTKPSVMIQRSWAPRPARALMVSRIAL